MLKSNCWIKFPPPSGLPGCIWSSAPSELCFPFGQTILCKAFRCLWQSVTFNPDSFEWFLMKHLLNICQLCYFFFFSFQRLYAATLLTGSFNISCLSKLIADDERFTLAAGLRIKTWWQKLHRNVQKNLMLMTLQKVKYEGISSSIFNVILHNCCFLPLF